MLRIKKSKRKIVIVMAFVTLLILGSSGTLLYIRSNQKPAVKPEIVHTKTTPSKAKTTAAKHYGLPKKIKIPSLSVESNIIATGLTKDGSMDVPDSLTDVGWYKLGTRPGENGAAVIAGHHGVQKDKDGVFKNLTKLAIGDSVQVIDEAGAVINFKVKSTQLYGSEESPGNIFTSSSGAHLNLITCTGVWDQAKQSFKSRLVVFTDAVE